MFRIARNSFLSSRTGPRGRSTVPLDAHDGDPALTARGTPETLLIEGTSRRLVTEAIEALPQDSREIVLLHDVEGFRYQEIADLLSIPIGTVMSRLHRARNAIRENVARRSNPGPTGPLRRIK
jgi:RNA polymerase sigma-70 factor (ECF subfamily)